MAGSQVFNSFNNAITVVPSDSVSFSDPIKALYVGGLGDVVAKMIDGTVVTFKAVAVGTVLPITCDRINATNTTATLMVGLL